MRNKKIITTDNAKLGMRIKVALPTIWCEVPDHHSPRVWMKGKIIDVNVDKKNPTKISAFTFSCKWYKHHYYFKIDRMWTAANKETGVFPQMYMCK